ncbi:MAG: S-layer homology domain-containing protein [Solibacillus sp.]
MKKYVLSLLTFILILAMALPAAPINAAQVFSDVPTNHSNYADIHYLLEKKVISADKKSYGIRDIVTREEVAVMVAKAVGLDGTPRATKFSDVKKSNPNSGYIQSAVEAGIINGYTDGTFKPNTKVTRGHMAAFISRAFDLPNGSKTFKDVKKGHTAFEAVSRLAAAKITTGYEDGTFKPNNHLTRAHISAFLARAIQYIERTNPSTKPGTKDMLVHFIDVGQGDSIFIQAPNGHNLLVDAGTKQYGDDVVAYLKSLNVKKIDYVVATHPDADHIGGLEAVLNAFTIGEFINSGKVHTTVTYKSLLETVLNKNIPYTEPSTGDLIALDRALNIQVLAVDAANNDSNNASIVLKATYNKVSFLLTGDAGVEVEKVITQKYDVAATILKAGHHGSNTSNSLAFLQKVNPEAVILSYGKENSYGHPHSEVIANVKQVGAKAYSTAQDGTIIVKTNGSTYSVDAHVFTVPENLIGDVKSGTYVIAGAPTEFQNCDAMRAYYPSGVQSTHPAYSKKQDRDLDNWACEK